MATAPMRIPLYTEILDGSKNGLLTRNLCGSRSYPHRVRVGFFRFAEEG
jgi:hypothetical protein